MPVHFLDRVHRPASGPVAVGIVLEVSLEDGFDHDLDGSLNHTITNGRNAERTLATIRFGDHHPPYRIRSVCLRDQFRAQARQPCSQARSSMRANVIPSTPGAPALMRASR